MADELAVFYLDLMRKERNAAQARVKVLEDALRDVMPWIGTPSVGWPPWGTPEAKKRNQEMCDKADAAASDALEGA